MGSEHLKRENSDVRSDLMRRVKGKNTRPELIVRQIAHALGYRFRLHRQDLPGCPDITFVSKKRAIFVHGCFWHRHNNCRRASTPKTRVDFWEAKFARNVARDIRKESELREAGWDVLVIWECETRQRDRLTDMLLAFLKAGEENGGSTLARHP